MTSVDVERDAIVEEALPHLEAQRVVDGGRGDPRAIGGDGEVLGRPDHVERLPALAGLQAVGGDDVDVVHAERGGHLGGEAAVAAEANAVAIHEDLQVAARVGRGAGHADELVALVADELARLGPEELDLGHARVDQDRAAAAGRPATRGRVAHAGGERDGALGLERVRAGLGTGRDGGLGVDAPHELDLGHGLALFAIGERGERDGLRRGVDGARRGERHLDEAGDAVVDGDLGTLVDRDVGVPRPVTRVGGVGRVAGIGDVGGDVGACVRGIDIGLDVDVEGLLLGAGVAGSEREQADERGDAGAGGGHQRTPKLPPTSMWDGEMVSTGSSTRRSRPPGRS